MLSLQLFITPVLLSLLSQISATPTEPQDNVARSLITPAAQLPKRQTTGPATCGYIEGDFRTPYVCPSGYTCSSSSYGEAARFACCNDQTCPNDFRQCIPSTNYAIDSISSTTQPITSCTEASSHCLYWLTISSTGVNSECAFYSLWSVPTDWYSTTSFFSMFCTDGPSPNVAVWPTATNAPPPPLQTVTCIPPGFSYATPTTTKCASAAVLLIPLIISNIMFLAANILMSSLRFQRKLKFWTKSKGADDPWSPWSGLSTVALSIIQAFASAALIRAGGYKANWVNLILLWLMRPRMLWAVMFLYSMFGNQYKRSGTDSLFADGILNILSIPIAAWFLEAYESNAAVCDNIGPDDTLDFGQANYIQLFNIAPLMYIPFAVVDLFIFVAFVWKRRLGRWWAAGAGFTSLVAFSMSWFFWINWVLYSQGSFCISDIGALAAIHGTFPLITAALRAWLT